MSRFRQRWENTYYSWVCVYITVLVTLIFGFQMYRYFVSAPAEKIRNDTSGPCSTASSPERNPRTLIPVIGVFFS